MRVISFFCLPISIVFALTAIALIVNTLYEVFSKSNESVTKKDVMKYVCLINVFLIIGIFLFLVYFIPKKNCEDAVRQCIKEQYGVVYNYNYSYIYNEGNFLYDNKYFTINIIKDIDNNKYVKVLEQTNDNNNNFNTVTLPLKK